MREQNIYLEPAILTLFLSYYLHITCVIIVFYNFRIMIAVCLRIFILKNPYS